LTVQVYQDYYFLVQGLLADERLNKKKLSPNVRKQAGSSRILEVPDLVRLP
jgi:hypothetical protein